MKFLAEMLWRDLYIRSLENSRRMLDHIYPYLLVHKKLQLAGLGTLEMVPVSAAIDPSGLHISAPYEKINFTPGQVLTNTSFIAWVAALDHIDIETASSTTHAAIEELASSLHLQQPVLIAGVGNFCKEGLGISFTAHDPLYAVQEALPLPTGLQWSFKKGLLYKAQPLSVMDRYWWVAAILLFAAGAATIFNYFLNINDQF
jgi:nucleoid DNA-binding protein